MVILCNNREYYYTGGDSTPPSLPSWNNRKNNPQTV